MRSDWLLKYLRVKRDAVTAGLIFAITFFIFIVSPISQVADSKYSMLLSQSLLEHRSFRLDNYAIPRLEPLYHDNTYKNGKDYQIELVGDHLYYYFPPGTSVLSAPFVAVMNLFGVSAANADGTFNLRGEQKIESSCAALLTAILTVIFFYTSRLLLPHVWSVVIALGGALGTQVWSTASRGLWTHTWGILLLGAAIFIVLAQETGKRKLNGVVLATLLAWMYFVRPTSSIFIVAVSIYIFLYHRRAFVSYAITGAVWFITFVGFSWYHYGQMLPNYYRADRLGFKQFWMAFAGNLVSPSRGLLIYVPVLLFISYLLARYRKQIAFPRLIWLALAVSVLHLVATAGFTPWNGGWCYGPRYSTDLVPWFVLLGILGIKAMLTWRDERSTEINRWGWNTSLIGGGVLLLLSIFINGRGAISADTARWNELPVNVDKVPNRVWDWTYPQFLAGLILPPPPDGFPAADNRINFAQRTSDRYLYYGWSGNESEFRWTDANEAAIVFGLKEITGVNLQMKMSPFVLPGRLNQQRMIILLNGHHLETLALREPAAREYSLTLPQEMLRHENILTFKLPDAASPLTYGVGDDPRVLGIAMHWLEIRSASFDGTVADRTAQTKAEMPLPDSALHAEISVIDPPDTLKAGEKVALRVTVKNVSGSTWPSLRENDDSERNWIRLGNHWLDANNKMLVRDDGRSALPLDLEPNETAELSLTIAVPQTPGEYVLEIDMAQELVSWFKDHESKTAQLRITVR